MCQSPFPPPPPPLLSDPTLFFFYQGWRGIAANPASATERWLSPHPPPPFSPTNPGSAAALRLHFLVDLVKSGIKLFGIKWLNLFFDAMRRIWAMIQKKKWLVTEVTVCA